MIWFFTSDFDRGFGSSRLARVFARLPSVCVALSLFVGHGCDRTTEPSVEQTEGQSDDTPARTEIERGPLRVTVEVEPKTARLSDEPMLTLTLDYERGLSVRKPPFGESLGDFIIRKFYEPLPEVKGSREIVKQIYTLEPTRTGQLLVHPIIVSFIDSRPDGDGEEHMVETEALKIDIQSVLGSEIPSLDALKPMAGPVELPHRRTSSVSWLGVLCLTAAGTIILVLRLKQRKKAAPEKQLSPQELAYLELQELLEGDLAETDIKCFYVELTGIVRRYIERTTGIRAPEQTTEEFLREIGRGATFNGATRQRLTNFLEAADLVKFARHQPRQEDVEHSFQRAKVFVGLEQEGGVAA